MRLSGPVSTGCACNKKAEPPLLCVCVRVRACACVREMYLSLKFQGKLSWDRRAKDYTCLIHTWPASMSQIDGAEIH